MATSNTDNGILASVGGQYVAEGARQLPDPETAAATELCATVDADAWVGAVRVTYQRQLARHGKHRHWFWRAIRAEALGQ